MAKIRIELDTKDWYSIERALIMAEMDEQDFAKRNEIYLETAQRNAEKYRNLFEEIVRQMDEYYRQSYRQEKNNGAD